MYRANVASHTGLALPNMKIGHYTQLVWAATEKIGCGYIKYKPKKEEGKRQFYYQERKIAYLILH